MTTGLIWDSQELKNMLKEESSSIGVNLSNNQADKFMLYGHLLAAGNERLNLSTITEPKEVIRKHFIDCLAALPYLPRGEFLLADVGSGAGLPGLALKIANPQMKVTLIESIKKKAAFLEETVGHLGLTNVDICSRRAEDVGQDPSHRERYLVVTARAVAALPVLLELCLPLIAVGGLFVAYKGPTVKEEIAAAQSALCQLGGRVQALQEFCLSTGEKRAIVLIEKSSSTPARFPRAAGRPAKKPL